MLPGIELKWTERTEKTGQMPSWPVSAGHLGVFIGLFMHCLKLTFKGTPNTADYVFKFDDAFSTK